MTALLQTATLLVLELPALVAGYVWRAVRCGFVSGMSLYDEHARKVFGRSR